MPDLETVDIEGVEILAAGTKVRGSLGVEHTYTTDEIDQLAAAGNELAGELRAPLKIGHNPEQRLAKASGLVDDDGAPALGWLENYRAEAGKLLVDVKNVPTKLADLVQAKAFRHRSAEVRRAPYESQATGKTYEKVPVGLALLGTTLPAFRTLDDIAALYADQGPAPVDVEVVVYAETVWTTEESLEWLRGRVCAALNPGPDTTPSRFWVRDIAVDKALVQEGWDEGAAAWVVPFSVTDGDVEVAPSTDWVLAEQQWVAASGEAAAYADDRRGRMPDLTLTDEQVKALAAKLGVEGDDLSPDQLLEHATKLAAERDEAKTKLEAAAAAPTGYSDADLAQLKADAKAGAEAKEQLRVMRRDTLIDKAVRGRKIAPAEVAHYAAFYDAAPDAAAAALDGLQPRPDLTTTYGDDDAGTGKQQTPEEAAAAEDAEFARYADSVGLPGLASTPGAS